VTTRLRALPPTPGRVAWAIALALGVATVERAEAAPCCDLAWQFPNAAPPPFSRQELEAAVAIRQPPGAGAAPDAVALAWAGDGIVQASTPLRRRVVTLGPARGSEAARLVALAVVDVLRPLGLPPELETVAARGSDAAEVRASALPEQGNRPETLTFALAGAVNRGATSAGFALEPTAAVAWRLAGGASGLQTGVVVEVGYGQGRGRAGLETLVVHLAPARLGLFLRSGSWALVAGGLARGYSTDGIAGGVSRVRGWLLGGHAAAQRALPLGRDFGLLVAAGVDVAANAVDFRVRGQSLLRTGRLVPTVRMGLLWRAR
jgi:hypothetical protein